MGAVGGQDIRKHLDRDSALQLRIAGAVLEDLLLRRTATGHAVVGSHLPQADTVAPALAGEHEFEAAVGTALLVEITALVPARRQ